MGLIKVSAGSRTAAVAGSIAGTFRDHHLAEVQAIGPVAVNQAVKAMTLAKRYLAEDGYVVVFYPAFQDVDIDGKIRTAVKFIMLERDQAPG